MSATNVARAGKRGNICVGNNVSATMCPRLPGPLDESRIAHSLSLSAPCDAMYPVRESKSKLELFYRMFIKRFCHIFLALGLNTCLNGVCNYRYIYQRDLKSFLC